MNELSPSLEGSERSPPKAEVMLESLAPGEEGQWHQIGSLQLFASEKWQGTRSLP
jgi:hypothetical protein